MRLWFLTAFSDKMTLNDFRGKPEDELDWRI
jgi:hypothetical protein